MPELFTFVWMLVARPSRGSLCLVRFQEEPELFSTELLYISERGALVWPVCKVPLGILLLVGYVPAFTGLRHSPPATT